MAGSGNSFLVSNAPTTNAFFSLIALFGPVAKSEKSNAFVADTSRN
jgi:hypothetical protein